MKDHILELRRGMKISMIIKGVLGWNPEFFFSLNFTAASVEYITDDHWLLELVVIATIHQKCLITEDQGNEEGQNTKI